MFPSFCRLTILLLLFVISFSTADAAEEVIVYIKGQDTPVFDCWLKDKPLLTFNDSGLTLHSSTLETTLKYKDIDHIEFKSNDTDILTDVEELEEEEPKGIIFKYLDNKRIIVDGVSDKAHVQQYSIDGKAAPLDVSRAHGRLTINLAHLQKGIYIIRVDNQTFKVFKK